MTKTFRDLGVDARLCDALEAQGIVHPFPIQELTLPLALDRHDLIGQARTGTGKTLAFGLPLLQQLDPNLDATQALVVVPTRELCVQVHDDLSIGEALGLRTISVYGGVGYDEQNEALTTGVHVVVGTPGRLIDHLNRGNLDLSQVRVLVLDEADEMLDMGFLPDVERLIQACPVDGRHTMLFSATMPTAIVKMARRYLDHPTFTRADAEEHETAPNVDQHFFSVHRMDKPRVLARILQSPERGRCYVFVRTKHMADRLVSELEELEVAAIAIHGDLRQQTRERNLDRFREGKADVLVATEVAARGLDVTGVTHVVNYDCPDDEKMYLHRIGRTARAGAAGVAVTFAEFNETDRMNVIRKAVGATDTDIEQVFSTSPRLQELFDLPDETPWAHLSRKSPSGGGRRSAASDGRPKNRRDREGSGRERDGRRRSSRDETPTGTGARGRGDAAAAERGTTGEGADAPVRRTERDEASARSGTRERTRERSRRRDADDTGDRSNEPRQARAGDAGSDDDTRADRSADAASSSGRTRARARSRSRSDAPAPERTTGDRSDTPSGGRGERGDDRNGGRDRQRDRGRSSTRGGGGDTRDRRDRGSDRASGRSDSGRSSSDRRTGDRGKGRTTSGNDRSESGNDRGKSGNDRGKSGNDRGRSGNDRGRSGNDRGKGGDDRGGRGGGAREPRDPSVQVQRRGRGARGEGEPQLARRVKVEHLP